MFDTVRLVREVSPMEASRFLNAQCGVPSRAGSLGACWWRGWFLPGGEYVQLKWAQAHTGHLMLERGHLQERAGHEHAAASLRSDVELLQGVDGGRDEQVRVARVDFVADTSEQAVLGRARDWLPPKRSRMVMCEYRDAKNPEELETVFYRNKSGALRVYDKAVEQGLSGVDWVRVELQLRRRYAADVLGESRDVRTLLDAGRCAVSHALAWERFGLSELAEGVTV